MMSSVPGRSRLWSRQAVGLGDRRARSTPFARAMPERVWPRRTTCLRKFTRFSGGRLGDALGHRLGPRPAGTRSAKVRSAGVASRRSSGFRARMSSTGSPAHSAITRRSMAPSIGTRSKSGASSGVTVKPYRSGALASTIAAWMRGT